MPYSRPPGTDQPVPVQSATLRSTGSGDWKQARCYLLWEIAAAQLPQTDLATRLQFAAAIIEWHHTHMRLAKLYFIL